MLISHRKKFIYTKTSRTAGTSVESYFEKFCMPEAEWEFALNREVHIGKEGIIGYRGYSPAGKKWRNHMPAIEIKEAIGHSVWDDYFKFCVIRNPFDKLVSGFFFFHKDKIDSDKISRIDVIKGFRKWIKNGRFIFDRDKYFIDENICIDYFIMHEGLSNGIREVCKLLDIPFESERIPALRTEFRDREFKLLDLYDKETRAIVSAKYEFELDYFGYEAPDLS